MGFRKQQSDGLFRCSFCNKSQRDVKKLIAGPEAYICDECVDICNDIIAEDRVLEVGAQAGPDAVPAVDNPVDAPIRCRLCQMLWPRGDCVPFPDRGWLCRGCLDHVRLYVDSAEESPK
jgi:hypothetical protein